MIETEAEPTLAERFGLVVAVFMLTLVASLGLALRWREERR